MKIELRVWNRDIPFETTALNNPTERELAQAKEEIEFVFGRVDPYERSYPDENLLVVDYVYGRNGEFNEIEIDKRRARFNKPQRKKHKSRK